MSTNDEEVRMYIVVNADAKMNRGKIAAQVGHAVMLVTEHLLTSNKGLYYQYKHDGMPKIVLKADASTIEGLANKSNFVIRDAGRTQVEAGTLTAIGFLPMTDSTRAKYYAELATLKLL